MRAVFFDLDGTLLRLTRPYGRLLADAFREVAGEVRAGWVDSYNDRFFELLEACEPEPYRRAFAATGADADPEALVAALREAELDASRLPEGTVAALERLDERYRLGVLTNGAREWQTGKLRAHGLESRFEAVVTAYDVGAHKPAPAAFRTAERRLPADAYAMVGDDPEADVRGAREAGWTAHQYEGDGFEDLPEALEWG